MKHWLMVLLMVSMYTLISGAAQSQDIIFMSYQCKGCDLNIPKKTKQDLQNEIAGQPDARAAGLKIQRYFRVAKGDNFMLNCEKCTGQKTYVYPVPSSLQPSGGGGLSTRTFATTSRGDWGIYTMHSLLDLIRDTVAVFDSASIDLAGMADLNTDVLSSFIVKYSYKGHEIARPIPFDAEGKKLTFSQLNFFGSHLKPDVTDSLSVKVFYLNPQGQERQAAAKLNYHFMTDKEKEGVLQLSSLYKKTFPAWGDEKIADELLPVLKEKYKIVNKDNLVMWLQSEKPLN